MGDRFRLTLGQLNATVGDLDGNAALARDAWEAGQAAGADLVALPEMFITGYNPQDLTLKPSFHMAAIETVRRLAKECADGPALAIGGPWLEGTELYNAYFILKGGKVSSTLLKHHLPNYGVFDEPRTFRPGPVGAPVLFRGICLGLLVCEDMWYPGPAEKLSGESAEILLVPHGSPYRKGVTEERLTNARARVTDTGLPLVFVNQVGGQDELVFDGGAFAVTPGGEIFRARSFAEDMVLMDWARGAGGWTCTDGPKETLVSGPAMTYAAAMLGTRDYVRKSRFSKVVLGLSGGIDSAMVAALAVDALGAENVHCVMMPSRYT